MLKLFQTRKTKEKKIKEEKVENLRLKEQIRRAYGKPLPDFNVVFRIATSTGGSERTIKGYTFHLDKRQLDSFGEYITSPNGENICHSNFPHWRRLNKTNFNAPNEIKQIIEEFLIEEEEIEQLRIEVQKTNNNIQSVLTKNHTFDKINSDDLHFILEKSKQIEQVLSDIKK